MFNRLIAYWFRRRGWIFTGTLPKRLPKSVIVAAPHTRDRDFFVALGVLSLTRFRTGILVDEGAMTGLRGWFLRQCRVISLPNDPQAARTFLLEEYRRHRTCSFVFTPYRKGKKGDSWNELFYDLASELDLPIVPVGLDNKRHRVKFHTHFYTSIDRQRDLGFLQRYFEGFRI